MVTAVAAVTAVALLAACTAGPDPTGAASTSAGPTGAATSPTSAPVTPTTPPTTPPTTSAAPTTTSAPAPASCVDRLVAGLTPEQKAGQLVMVGAQAAQPVGALDAVLRDQRVGGVTLLGTWSGSATVSAAVAHWQSLGTAASGGIGTLVAADQEGGQVQHVRGAGFTSTASALAQGRSPAGVARTSSTVGAQLRSAGVDVDLAPVADTVTAAFAPRNAPIGALDREYGHDPATVAASVRAAVGGLQGAGVSAALKHFPGLGRVTGNTDLTASGTTDDTTTADDAYLGPFRAGIEAGADLVMVSSALYPRIDPDHRAAFSPAVVTGLLRQGLGFTKVVVTDDVGAAKAVAAVPVGERATQFVAAGGDIVLTGLPSTVPTMTAALVDRAAADPAFAAQVDAAVTRVLDLKTRHHLTPCA